MCRFIIKNFVDSKQVAIGLAGLDVMLLRWDESCLILMLECPLVLVLVSAKMPIAQNSGKSFRPHHKCVMPVVSVGPQDLAFSPFFMKQSPQLS